ncbi:MAG TPA: hypothetical protein VNZ48_11550 [Xanthobacteraceae bacterium]|nr:hypothetical protein [Xanthobacteraceae bacterium]
MNSRTTGLHEVAEEHFVHHFFGNAEIQRRPFRDAKVQPVHVSKCIVREVKADNAREDRNDQKQNYCRKETNNLKRATNGEKQKMFSCQRIEVQDIDGVLHLSGPTIW